MEILGRRRTGPAADESHQSMEVEGRGQPLPFDADLLETPQQESPRTEVVRTVQPLAEQNQLLAILRCPCLLCHNASSMLRAI